MNGISAWRLKKQYYTFVGQICPKCDKKIFPSKAVCPSCGYRFDVCPVCGCNYDKKCEHIIDIGNEKEVGC